ncbi:hypothetical protein TNIN_285771 [Trichonephila inaurata madagascariensis]|uniref:Uncharacterized protein n=1 Tax=Trichonephila inaurata madagascariensis TaxID=2747483 RepID=A0A8X7CQL0_9ARAC|nr:hypothetical protein TNIN_285771 [Trichonephila inaurata madagascariensis]
MDPGNLNKLSDYSALRTQFNFRIQSTKNLIEQSEIVLNYQEKIFSLDYSNFTELISQYSSLEGSELEKIKADFFETEVLMTRVKSLLEFMKKIHCRAKDKLEFKNLHVSEHDCRNEVTEIKRISSNCLKQQRLLSSAQI